ncbi:MAG: hypothetical protein AAGF24_09005 [Cyanobacteria bacterium P01_H01_bin.121]
MAFWQGSVNLLTNFNEVCLNLASIDVTRSSDRPVSVEWGIAQASQTGIR